jgi:hypothetical protein
LASGPVHRSPFTVHLRHLALLALLITAAPLPAQSLPSELDGWPVIELTRVARPNGETWVGTYGHGVLVQPDGGGTWRRIRSDTSATSLSWNFVHAIAFGPRDQVWVGTIGNGWGLSRNDGRTWKNWTFTQLGPEWQYVAPQGIVTVGDTTIIATADGLQVTADDGARWYAVVDAVGPAAKGPADTARRILPTEYLTSLMVLADGPARIVAPGSRCPDGTIPGSSMLLPLSYPFTGSTGSTLGLPGGRAGIFVDAGPRRTEPVAAPLPGAGQPARPDTRTWIPPFVRPIRPCDNAHIDQTYRFGSTMGGNFQPHQGVEFNNADGTPVLAIGDGSVVWAAPAEQGALTVAIRHDDPLFLPGGEVRYIYSVYYHNAALDVAVGDRVRTRQQIARVGNTGRATNDHLHLEVHASPVDSVRYIVDPAVRFPPHVTNPELWIEPLPGTGAIAGQVFDAAGKPVPQARVYGITKPLPRETPLAFAETYGPRNKPSPMYGEHFAISDIPAGMHRLRVKIGAAWVEREVTVAAGTLTWVEFRP